MRGCVPEQRVEPPPIGEVSEQGAERGVRCFAIRRRAHDQLARGASRNRTHTLDSFRERQRPDVVLLEERDGVRDEPLHGDAASLNHQQVSRHRRPDGKRDE